MTSHSLEYTVVLACLFVLGSIIGSLLNVCIYRLPRAEGFWAALRYLWSPPSHCPRCQSRIPLYDNIPIFGWLLLGGRCRRCKGKISFRYPAIELLTALSFVLLYWFEIPDWWAGPKGSCLYHVYGPQTTPGVWALSPSAMLYWRYSLHVALLVALIVATFIDIDLRIIPDTVTLPAMGLALAANCIIGQVYVVPVWYQTPEMRMAFPMDARMFLRGLSPPPVLPGWIETWMSYAGVPAWIGAHPHWHGLVVSLAGILVGGGIVWGVRVAGQWALRQEAMGFGDVVLLAMIGSFLGWQATLVVFFIAPAIALIVAAAVWLFRRHREIPYGPYLSAATIVVILFWSPIFRWLEPPLFALGPLLPVVGLVMLVALAGALRAWRMLLRRLGFAADEQPGWISEWTSADQLLYMAGERRDDRQGQWPRPEWPGRPAGGGLIHESFWKSPAAPLSPALRHGSTGHGGAAPGVSQVSR